MAYIYGERTQTQLLPSSIEDYIAPEDPVRAYDAFIEQIDFHQVGIVLDPDQVGHPEFDPRTMLKLLVYGYAYGIRSSRKLERATHHNLSFIWLMGGLKPDHKTIARFRRDHRDVLKNVLKQCAYLCVKLGLIEGNTLFVDGTKIRANASMKHTWTPKRCEKALQDIDQRIETILKECDQTDHIEQDQSSLIKMEQALQNQQHLKTQIQGILKELQNQDKTAINTTDPECGRYRNGSQIEVGYNCQVVVDDKHGLIVHSDVVQDNCDANQFSPQVAKAQDVLPKSCQTACADAGYANTEGLKETLDQGIDVIVPSVRQVKEPSTRFRKEHFVYDSKKDCYHCPQGHPLPYLSDHKTNKSRIYQIRDPLLCMRCPYFGRCTTSTQGRRVERMFLEDVRERLEARYLQADAQKIFRRRKLRVEHPFGHLKHNLGMRFFLLRGLAGARAEAALATTAFNLVRIIKLLGTEPFLKRLSPASA